jgi:hypothetical protein
VENPYWQYLSGMEFFCHEPPIDPSSMSRWRRRVGEAGSEELLRQTIETGLKLKVIKPSELRRVNVDTTVQEKHIRDPTDPRLYDRMRERLVAAARREGVVLRQSYVRVGKRLLAQQSRYAHARQWGRARGCPRKLRTILGRVIRDIERKDERTSADTENLLTLAKRLYRQNRQEPVALDEAAGGDRAFHRPSQGGQADGEVSAQGNAGGQSQRRPQRGGHDLLQAPRRPRSFAVVFAGSACGALCPSFAP